MSASKPNLDDIEADAQNLVQLLATIVDQLMNIEYPAEQGSLDRVGSLSIIARDMSERSLNQISACNTARSSEFVRAQAEGRA